MKTTCYSLGLLLITSLAACGGSKPPAEESATPQPAETDASTEAAPIPMTNLPPLKIGPYDVQPMYEDELRDGHFNIHITGADVAAVRGWVGPEDADGVVVAKTEIENGYHHGHVEMPRSIPADARLWIEIEPPDGQRLKGSTPLRG